MVVEAFETELTSNAALTYPSPWRRWIESEVIVDPDNARLHRSGHAMSARQIVRPHRRGESVRAVVRERQRLGFGREGRDTRKRSENLFLKNTHFF
jgi:hypothetical protein